MQKIYVYKFCIIKRSHNLGYYLVEENSFNDSFIISQGPSIQFLLNKVTNYISKSPVTFISCRTNGNALLQKYNLK